MKKKCASIFLPLLIAMVIKVDSKFHRTKGLNVYDIERWNMLKTTGNDNEKYDSTKSVGSEGQGRRTLSSLEDLLPCEWLMDCDDSSETSSEEDSSSPSRPTTSRPWKKAQTKRILSSSIPSTTSSPTTSDSAEPVSLMSLQELLFCDWFWDCDEPSSSLTPTSTTDVCPPIPKGFTKFQCNSRAYKFYRRKTSWQDARSRCLKQSAQLVVIENGVQYDSVIQLAKRKIQSTDIHFWIGFNRASAGDPWVTVYGNRLSFEKWSTCQSDNNSDNENCGGFTIATDSLEGLSNSACDLRLSYMCEIKLPPNCT